MAVRYADEVRKERKDVEQGVKVLVNELVDKQKRRITRMALLAKIAVTGQRGQVQTDLRLLRQEITKLDQEIEILTAKIDPFRERADRLDHELKTAPKRPKTRSQVASIAASGSKTISRAANEKPQPKSAAMAWDSAIAAALHTASKYELSAIPPASLAIMESRLLDHYPTARLIQKTGAYPSVELLPTRKSVRQK